jgi:Zn-dependent protease
MVPFHKIMEQLPQPQPVPQPQTAQPQQPGAPQTLGQRIKQFFAPLLVALAAAGKFILPILKFGWPLLKMGGFMFLSVWVYARIWGWAFAVGFVVLIFIHECGHLIAARLVGLKVGLPVFIPFMGALIALKEAPRNAWIEAIVGIGGPLLGTAGAAVALGCYYVTGNPFFAALAYVGFLINLFNLIPVVPLDGGRIVSAISPWLWVIGLVILIPYIIIHASGFSIIIILLVLLSFRRIVALFRPRSPEQQRYFECTPSQRATMAILYFGLLAGLMYGMVFARTIAES